MGFKSDIFRHIAEFAKKGGANPRLAREANDQIRQQIIEKMLALSGPKMPGYNAGMVQLTRDAAHGNAINPHGNVVASLEKAINNRFRDVAIGELKEMKPIYDQGGKLSDFAPRYRSQFHDAQALDEARKKGKIKGVDKWVSRLE